MLDGRAGLGGQSWLTYSLSPRTKLQFGYRHQKVSSAFGRLVDYSLRGDILAGHNLALPGICSSEQWRFPVIRPSQQCTVVASMQLTFYPHLHIGR